MKTCLQVEHVVVSPKHVKVHLVEVHVDPVDVSGHELHDLVDVLQRGSGGRLQILLTSTAIHHFSLNLVLFLDEVRCLGERRHSLARLLEQISHLQIVFTQLSYIFLELVDDI